MDTTMRQAQGLCVVCGRQTWGYVDDPALDPRGEFGLGSSAPFVADDHGCEGADVPCCYGCYQEHASHDKGLSIAKAQWSIAPFEPLACPFCGSHAIETQGYAGPECEDCGANAKNLESWNRRVAIPAPRAPIGEKT